MTKDPITHSASEHKPHGTSVFGQMELRDNLNTRARWDVGSPVHTSAAFASLRTASATLGFAVSACSSGTSSSTTGARHSSRSHLTTQSSAAGGAPPAYLSNTAPGRSSARAPRQHGATTRRQAPSRPAHRPTTNTTGLRDNGATRQHPSPRPQTRAACARDARAPSCRHSRTSALHRRCPSPWPPRTSRPQSV